MACLPSQVGSYNPQPFRKTCKLNRPSFAGAQPGAGESATGAAIPCERGASRTLTLQEVGRQEGSRGVRAGQTLLQKVSLKLQGKQVSRREFQAQRSAPKLLNTLPTSVSGGHTAPGHTRADGEQGQSQELSVSTRRAVHTPGGPHAGHTIAQGARSPGATPSRGKLTNSCHFCEHAQNCTRALCEAAEIANEGEASSVAMEL